MDKQNEKCVMVIDEHLPLGIIGFPVPIPEVDLNYLGIAICGGKKKVNRLTGSMPLLR